MRDHLLSPERKQVIAQEFGHPVTAFLYDAPGPDEPRHVDLYTPNEEIGFSSAGLLAAAHYIFRVLEPRNTPVALVHDNTDFTRCILHTTVGDIQAHFNRSRKVASIDVPHEIHVHSVETTKDEVLAIQRQMLSAPEINKMYASYPLFSLSRGRTYTLVNFTDCPSLFDLIQPAEAPDPGNVDPGWRTSPGTPSVSIIGAVYYLNLHTDASQEPYITCLAVRAIFKGKEEPVSADACCAVSAYLALQQGNPNARYAYAIEQGANVGRCSELCVDVQLDHTGAEISRITLSGWAAFSMEGKLI